MRIQKTAERRFWSNVALPNGQGCMLWTGGTFKQGYGRFYVGNRGLKAHRISYVIAYGEIPDGLVIDHVRDRGCTNRHCVAPEHLEAVTGAENTRRGDVGKAAGARERAKTHCPQNHAYDEANTHIRPNGKRRCRTCAREQERRRYNEGRAA
jgi:hypothetical protein